MNDEDQPLPDWDTGSEQKPEELESQSAILHIKLVTHKYVDLTLLIHQIKIHEHPSYPKW